MLLIDDNETLNWLQKWLDAPKFDWDRGNREKNLKHNISDEEIEFMFNNPILFVGMIIEPPHDETRWLLLGNLVSTWACIFTRRGNKLRVISCRKARAQERRLYEENR